QELHRRKVITTTLIYMIASIVLIVGVEVIAEAMGANPKVVDTVAFVLIGGAPFVVALAWMFDITTEGVEHTGSKNVKLSWKKVGLPLLAAGLLAFIALSFYSLNKSEATKPAQHQTSPSR